MLHEFDLWEDFSKTDLYNFVIICGVDLPQYSTFTSLTADNAE